MLSATNYYVFPLFTKKDLCSIHSFKKPSQLKISVITVYARHQADAYPGLKVALMCRPHVPGAKNSKQTHKNKWLLHCKSYFYFQKYELFIKSQNEWFVLFYPETISTYLIQHYVFFLQTISKWFFDSLTREGTSSNDTAWPAGLVCSLTIRPWLTAQNPLTRTCVFTLDRCFVLF